METVVLSMGLTLALIEWSLRSHFIAKPVNICVASILEINRFVHFYQILRNKNEILRK